MTTTTTAAPDVPPMFRDYAFEFKLGWEAGTNAAAPCPIKSSFVDADVRAEAWKAGWKARRKALGKPQMRPLSLGRPALQGAR